MMKTRWLLTLLTAAALVVAAWIVRTPKPALANEVPEKFRETVRRGLDHLAAKQHKDGHWEGDEGKHPVAMTAVVGLALFMDAATSVHARSQRLLRGKYTGNIRKAVDWLVNKSLANRDGPIFSGHDSEVPRYMEGHGLATLFLAGVYGEEEDLDRKKLHEVLTRAVKYIVRSQSSLGGWYHTSKLEGHDLDAISATVIQLQALTAAEKAGVAVPRTAIHDGGAYLKNALARLEKTARGSRQHARHTAEVLGALSISASASLENREESYKSYLGRLRDCQAELPATRAGESDRDDLARFYLSQAMVCLNGPLLDDHATKLFDQLQKKQNTDGSWPAPPFAEGIGAGPVYATALWCTVLQLERRCYPSMTWPIVETR